MQMEGVAMFLLAKDLSIGQKMSEFLQSFTSFAFLNFGRNQIQIDSIGGARCGFAVISQPSEHVLQFMQYSHLPQASWKDLP